MSSVRQMNDTVKDSGSLESIVVEQVVYADFLNDGFLLSDLLSLMGFQAAVMDI